MVLPIQEHLHRERGLISETHLSSMPRRNVTVILTLEIKSRKGLFPFKSGLRQKETALLHAKVATILSNVAGHLGPEQCQVLRCLGYCIYFAHDSNVLYYCI